MWKDNKPNEQGINPRLLTWEQFFALPDLPPDHPYVFQIEKEGQELFYFGSWHKRDINSNIAKSLQKSWQEFKVTHLDELPNIIILIEGGKRPLESSPELAIARHAEFGLITYLASLDNVQVDSADAPHWHQYQELLMLGYTRDQIQYFFFMQVVHQYVHLLEGHQPVFEEYMERFLARDRSSSRWKDYDFSLKHMVELHEEMFNRKFELTDFKFFEELMLIQEDTFFTQRIKRDLILIRDTYVVERIKSEWDAGKHIFVVFGATHARIQEPAIKTDLY